jgi:thiol:disulfide interchange protein DsbD
MIPMTVSFYKTKQSKNSKALTFIFYYVVLGFLVTWIFGADALNALSTNVWFNIIFFFVLLVVLLHYFKGAILGVDSQADRGGIIGILFMALALDYLFLVRDQS